MKKFRKIYGFGVSIFCESTKETGQRLNAKGRHDTLHQRGQGGELSHLSCRIARPMNLAIVTSRAVSPGKFKLAAIGNTKSSTSCDDHWKNWQQSD